MFTLEGVPGAALVTVGGSTVVESAGAPATSGTRFPIASVGKQFAAVAALLLAERGALRLDQPVARWLPGGAAWWRDVTLHHLLTHTSGLGHWGDAPGFDFRVPMETAARLKLIAQAEAGSRPGVRWLYSSPAYLVVAHVVEQAAGQPYGEFLAEHLCTPLGLTSTTSAEPADALAGTSDVWSTVGDVARWTELIHSDALLGWESRAVLTGPLAPTGAERQPGRTFFGPHYGYGLFSGTVGGQRAYFHPGDIPGYVSFAAWLPDRRAALVLLTARDDTDVHALTRQLLTAAGLT